MDNLDPIFNITNPNRGKSEVDVFRDRVRQMQEQALQKQMGGIESTEQQIAQQPQGMGRDVQAIAALTQLVSPESRAFDTTMAMENQRQRQQMGLQRNLAQQNRSLMSTLGGLAGDESKLGEQKELAQYKSQLNKELSKQQADQASELAKLKATLKGSNGESGQLDVSKLGPGQRELDKSFAKDNDNFYSTTLPKLDMNLRNLKDVSGKLSNKDSNLTGTGAGAAIAMGSLVGGAINEDAVQAYDLVRQVVQQDLRETLGAQFTENEGKLMIEATYNPSLSPEKNKLRIDRLIEKTDKMRSIRKRENDFFRKNRTLYGFDYDKMNEDIASLSQEIKDEFLKSGAGSQETVDKLGSRAQELADKLGIK